MTAYTYDFTGTDGSAPTAPAGYPALIQFNGAWTIQGGRASTITDRTTNPMLLVQVGAGDVELSANVGNGGGDCLYFRVVDVSNWFRVRVRNWTTSSAWYYTEYQWAYDNFNTEWRWVREEWAINGTFHSTTDYGAWQSTEGAREQYTYSHSHSPYGSHTMSVDKYWESRQVYTGTSYQWAQSSPGAGWYNTGSSRQVYGGTNYYTNYGVYLEKSTAGSVVGLGSSTTQPTSLRVTAFGGDINVYINGSGTAAITTTDNTFLTANRHGIGRGTSENNGQSLDNMTIDGQTNVYAFNGTSFTAGGRSFRTAGGAWVQHNPVKK